MKKHRFADFPIVGLIVDLLLVYVAYTLCRLAFLLINWDLYAGSLTFGHALSLFLAGLRFDTTAILYTNVLVMLLVLLPCHWKERPAYYRLVRWVFVVVNAVAIAANLADCVYFPYTGKRTTASVFAEFSHEGAGNLSKIFWGQMLSHWYLVVLFVVLVAALWWAFRPRPRQMGQRCRPTLFYYASLILALAASIPLTIGGMRGGFTHAVRPITISNANQYVDRPIETGIVLNTPFAIFRTLSKRPFPSPHYMSDGEALSLYSPVHQPTDTAQFRPMNVVVLILESFSKQHFGFYNTTLRGGTYQGFTPFLDSLITHQALTFQYSYANGRKSIEGMPSVLSSLPNYVEPLFLTPASLNHMSGLARELREQKGYTTAFFHGAENGSMGFQAFANTTGFEHYYGRTEYNRSPRHNGDADYDGIWAIWDEEFLQYYAEEMTEMKEPFMTAVFTASSHDPFRLPERYANRFPKGERQLQQCIAYTDYALRRFFETASRAPWFGRTLFVITADHTSNNIDPFYTTTLGSYSVPIILYAPGLPDLHRYDTERIVQQADIMPTVLSLLHYDHPYIAFGTDMLAAQARPFALHWVPEFSGYQYLEDNYLLQFDGQKVTAAYRFRTDSLLQTNVLGTMPQDTLLRLENRMKSVIQQYMQRMNNDSLVVRK